MSDTGDGRAVDEPCEGGAHCCCCGPGEPCCDCGEIMPDWRAKAKEFAEVALGNAIRVGELEIEVANLQHRLAYNGSAAGLRDGEWFYPEGDHSSDECRFSPDEVIDYALEGETVSRVVAIERAVSLPTVYAAVRVWSDEEKDARQSDDEYDYTLHATAEAARAALSPNPVKQETIDE